MSDAIALFLKDAIGLHGGTVGSSVIDHAIRQRMSACRITDVELYRKLLAVSGDERQQLINAVVVPETWFFRDPEAFTASVRHLREATGLLRPIRLLSLPSSTGEEPYSLAISLLDAGFGVDEFCIDAVDVSTQNLGKAERAIYGRNSFRGRDQGSKADYFDTVDGGLQPIARVRETVTFINANLFDWNPAPGQLPYEVIFCRNLLIYFDRGTQERALRRLAAWLSPDGLLLVGPGESGIPPYHGYVSIRSPRAFAFRKTERSPGPATQPRPAPEYAIPAMVSKPAATPIRKGASAKPSAVPAPRTEPLPSARQDASASLNSIEQAANAGRIGEAKDIAAGHLSTFGPSPEIYYMMGLISDASGARAAAIQHYRRAIYLDPEHTEALAHLALALQSQGDLAGARVLNARLARLGQARREQ